MNTRTYEKVRRILSPLVVALLTVGCERSTGAPKGASPSPAAGPAARSEVDFPDSLRVPDESVNRAIDNAIAACFSGDYERFRRLWSIRQNPPFAEQEFDIALTGGAKVAINRLQKFRTPEGDVVYAVAGRIELFDSRIPDPVRDVILLLVRESDEWRLAVAPSFVREALNDLDRATQNSNPDEIPVTPMPKPSATQSPSPKPTPASTNAVAPTPVTTSSPSPSPSSNQPAP